MSGGHVARLRRASRRTARPSNIGFGRRDPPHRLPAGHLHALIAVLVFGLVIGVFGHIISSSADPHGILIIGGVSAYFAFGFSHVT